MRPNCGTPLPNGCGQWHHTMWGPHSYGSFEVQWPIEHFLLHKRQAEPSMTQLMKNQSSPQWQWKEEANFFFSFSRFPLPGDVFCLGTQIQRSNFTFFWRSQDGHPLDEQEPGMPRTIFSRAENRWAAAALGKEAKEWCWTRRFYDPHSAGL